MDDEDDDRRPPYRFIDQYGDRLVVKCKCGSRAEHIPSRNDPGSFYCHVCDNEYDYLGRQTKGWDEFLGEDFGIRDQVEFDTQKCGRCKKLIYKTAKHRGYRRTMTAYTVRLYEALPRVETGWLYFCAECDEWFFLKDPDVPFNFVCRNGLCPRNNIVITAERQRQDKDPPRSWIFECLGCGMKWNYNRDYQSAWEQFERSASPGTPPSSDSAPSPDDEDEEPEDYDPERESSPEE